ncbi:MAG: hypothetical protein HC844_04570 [Tabrizicola sp.]|nr:hypothetical protein [Tabrizicola sp.]
MGWLRLGFFVYVGLTIVYFLTSIYSRSVRREKLEKEFDAGGIEGDRSAFITAGMAQYDKGLKKKLLWLIYILPTIAFGVVIYFVNWD